MEEIKEKAERLSIQDYAMYLGVNVRYIKENEVVTRKLTPWLLESINEEMLGGANIPQLILKKAEDMTEEEAIELLVLQEREYIIDWITKEQFEAYPERKEFGAETALSRIKDEDEWFNDSLSHSIGSPKVWKYLLSKGFDVFGYIDKGLAINKVTLTESK